MKSQPVSLTTTALLVSIASAMPAHHQANTPRQATSAAIVNLNTLTGAANNLASGFIYGWPDNGTSASTAIPGSLVTGINFHSSRAGGAQLSSPALGWAAKGYDSYIGRFDSTLSNYRTTRLYGGDFILLPHDLWGADGKQDGSSIFPGDNGNWTEMEVFWNQVISDLKANDMLEGLVIDIWNEPDVDSFWHRTWDQYLEYWTRAVRLLRAELPGTLLSGPSAASSARIPTSSRWTSWFELLAGNGSDTVPDIYSWHHLSDLDTELDVTVPTFKSLLEQYALPESKYHFDINEYGWTSEQNPAASAWFIGQLERNDCRGLRANWASSTALHDSMANLVYPLDDQTGSGVDGSDYKANGEWYVYEYYAAMSEGDDVQRVNTTTSSDKKFDVFATVKGGSVKLLAGTRSVAGDYEIQVNGLPDTATEISVRAIVFDWAGATSDTGAPVDQGVSNYAVQSGSITIPVSAGNSTAYAFELEI